MTVFRLNFTSKRKDLTGAAKVRARRFAAPLDLRLAPCTQAQRGGTRRPLVRPRKPRYLFQVLIAFVCESRRLLRADCRRKRRRRQQPAQVHQRSIEHTNGAYGLLRALGA